MSTRKPRLSTIAFQRIALPVLSPRGVALFGLMLVAAMHFTLRRTRLDRSAT